MGAFGPSEEIDKASGVANEAVADAGEEGEDGRFLAEALRIAERILDHQARAIERLDEKSQNAITLGVAALGGGLALGSLVTTRDPAMDVIFEALFAGAGALNLAALLLLLDAYTGLRSQRFFRYGVSIAWMASYESFSVGKLHRSLLATLHEITVGNHHTMRLITRRRRQGLGGLMGAVALYAFALVYIVGRAVG